MAEKYSAKVMDHFANPRNVGEMPDADGIDVLKSLRSDSRTASLPIVALSASVMQWEMDAALDAGATRYWSKPIDFEAFRAGVAEFLLKAHEHAGAERGLGKSAG